MSIKIKIPEGVEPIPGNIFIMPLEPITSATKNMLTEVRQEVDPHQPAIVLLTNPQDPDGDIRQGDMVYYGTHAASGVEVKDQQFLTIPRSAVIGKIDG